MGVDRHRSCMGWPHVAVKVPRHHVQYQGGSRMSVGRSPRSHPYFLSGALLMMMSMACGSDAPTHSTPAATSNLVPTPTPRPFVATSAVLSSQWTVVAQDACTVPGRPRVCDISIRVVDGSMEIVVRTS